jgi:hypothetical protein
MMDLKLLLNLHDNLAAAKQNLEVYFDGLNVIFMGDFLQIPTVSHLGDKPSQWELGHLCGDLGSF